MQQGWVRRVLLVTLFGVAFGYVEAAVVVYLRVIYDPVRASLHPEQPPDSLLPLVTLQELRAEDPEHVTRLAIELGRELATLVMLVVAAALARRRRGEWIAFFMIVFGVWDIAYYLGLKAMIGFPASLMTWDILFLVPLPWLGPVLAPVVVSLTMIGAGCVMLRETEHERPLQARWYHWTGIVAGGLIVIWSFCKDYEQTLAGEMPNAYSWPLFALGELVGMAAFAHALRQGRTRVASR